MPIYLLKLVFFLKKKSLQKSIYIRKNLKPNGISLMNMDKPNK
jgi:hypothetical protein